MEIVKCRLVAPITTIDVQNHETHGVVFAYRIHVTGDFLNELSVRSVGAGSVRIAPAFRPLVRTEHAPQLLETQVLQSCPI